MKLAEHHWNRVADYEDAWGFIEIFVDIPEEEHHAVFNVCLERCCRTFLKIWPSAFSAFPLTFKNNRILALFLFGNVSLDGYAPLISSMTCWKVVLGLESSTGTRCR
jgi:hypothetical protein